MPPFASFADRCTSVSDKGYFPYERSAAARSHAAGTPGHAAEGVLAVEPQQVVLGEGEAADRRLGFYPAVWSMPVVSVQPEGQFLGASLRGGVGLGVGPFAERGLDEALGLAVGLRGIG